MPPASTASTAHPDSPAWLGHTRPGPAYARTGPVWPTAAGAEAGAANERANGGRAPAQRAWAPSDRGRLVRLLGIVVAHLALAVAGWQVVLRPNLVSNEPLRVVIVEPPRTENRLPELPRPQQQRWQAPPLQPPEVQLQRPPEPEPRVSTPQTLEPVQPLQPPPPEAPRVAAAPPPPPPPPPAPTPAPPRQMPASAVAYLVPPPIEVPLASRRLGEQGTVWLRVLVGADGAPRQVTVQKSSGFARLDEQALSAMRKARFKPQVDNGVAVEWIVVAPLQYEIT